MSTGPGGNPHGLASMVEPARLETVLGLSGRLCPTCQTLTLHPIGTRPPACRLCSRKQQAVRP